MRFSLPVKEIVLTSIAQKGIAQTRKDAQQIADSCYATKSAVLNWVRKVEKGEIIIK